MTCEIVGGRRGNGSMASGWPGSAHSKGLRWRADEAAAIVVCDKCRCSMLQEKNPKGDDQKVGEIDHQGGGSTRRQGFGGPPHCEHQYER